MALTSEDAKNWFTIAAIAIGGAWVLFEYYGISSQRTADALEAATVRSPRIAAELHATVVGYDVDESHIVNWLPHCEQNEGRSIRVVPLEARIALRVEGIMTAPVSVTLSELEISRMTPYDFDYRSLDPTTISASLGPSNRYPISEEIVLSGRSTYIIEPGEINTYFIVGYIPIHFSCTSMAQFEEEFAISLIFTMRTEDADGTTSGSGVHSAFIVCGVSYSASRSCLAPTVAPQVETETEVVSLPWSTGVISQQGTSNGGSGISQFGWGQSIDRGN